MLWRSSDASHQGAEYISVSYQGIFGGENPFLEDGTAAIIGSGANGWIVIIAQGLTSISVNDIKMAVGGTYTMTINTVPEGIDLNDISLSIPEITSGVPCFTAECIAGTNDYTLTGEYPAVEAFSITADGVSTRAWVYIGQKFAFEEGWSWISNYALAPLEFSNLGNLQEVRSQAALTYNDPEYGWFGDLEEMGQEMYKVNVATGKSFSFLNISQNIGFYNGNHDFTAALSYNPRKFADNMAIVADLGTDVDTDRYSVYAFVGDECRGEGKAVNGRYFITAYGNQGEYVTLRVIDNETGEMQTANLLHIKIGQDILANRQCP